MKSENSSRGHSLKNVPSFDRNSWPNMFNRQWGDEIHKYYGQMPYWESEASENTAYAHPSGSHKASDLIGTAVKNQQRKGVTPPFRLVELGDFLA